MEYCDAIKEADGVRILRCWCYLMLIFYKTSRNNYAVTMLIQYHFLFSSRIKEQLLWSRTVNIHGKPGKNVPMDLHMEHLNREVKRAVSHLGPNVLGNSIQRVSKCIGELGEITNR